MDSLEPEDAKRRPSLSDRFFTVIPEGIVLLVSMFVAVMTVIIKLRLLL